MGRHLLVGVSMALPSSPSRASTPPVVSPATRPWPLPSDTRTAPTPSRSRHQTHAEPLIRFSTGGHPTPIHVRGPHLASAPTSSVPPIRSTPFRASQRAEASARFPRLASRPTARAHRKVQLDGAPEGQGKPARTGLQQRRGGGHPTHPLARMASAVRTATTQGRALAHARSSGRTHSPRARRLSPSRAAPARCRARARWCPSQIGSTCSSRSSRGSRVLVYPHRRTPRAPRTRWATACLPGQLHQPGEDPQQRLSCSWPRRPRPARAARCAKVMRNAPSASRSSAPGLRGARLVDEERAELRPPPA